MQALIPHDSESQSWTSPHSSTASSSAVASTTARPTPRSTSTTFCARRSASCVARYLSSSSCTCSLLSSHRSPRSSAPHLTVTAPYHTLADQSVRVTTFLPFHSSIYPFAYSSVHPLPLTYSATRNRALQSPRAPILRSSLKVAETSGPAQSKSPEHTYPLVFRSSNEREANIPLERSATE